MTGLPPGFSILKGVARGGEQRAASTITETRCRGPMWVGARAAARRKSLGREPAVVALALRVT